MRNAHRKARELLARGTPGNARASPSMTLFSFPLPRSQFTAPRRNGRRHEATTRAKVPATQWNMHCAQISLFSWSMTYKCTLTLFSLSARRERDFAHKNNSIPPKRQCRRLSDESEGQKRQRGRGRERNGGTNVRARGNRVTSRQELDNAGLSGRGRRSPG